MSDHTGYYDTNITIHRTIRVSSNSSKLTNKTSDRAFAVAAATTGNRLPPKVRTATSTEQFSRALKTHLFTLDWSRGPPWCLWLIISTDELWCRIQIEWLNVFTVIISWQCSVFYLFFMALHMWQCMFAILAAVQITDKIRLEYTVSWQFW